MSSVSLGSPESDGRPTAFTVTQAMNTAKRALSAIDITVVGEVSELSDKPGYKAVYFTLTDKTAAMSCLMWRNVFDAAGIVLRQGMLVEVSGSFGVYVQKGRMNFTVRSLRQAGEGDLRLKVAQLAEKLRREGLMDDSRKRRLPSMPQHIAVVTSPRGKAVHDCLRTLRRRYPLAEVYVCGVPVEGANAPAEIIHALEVAAASDAEVILLVRGGGSYEDLMPFNDEALARAVANSPTPVVTGIGHEPDNSIVDMVSDRRCSTPTAAAEAVAPSLDELAAGLQNRGVRCAAALAQRLERVRSYLDAVSSRPLFSNPQDVLSQYGLGLDAQQERLHRAIPEALVRDERTLSRSYERFEGLEKTLFTRFDKRLAVDASRLQDLSPLSILSRGYAVAYAADGHSVVDAVSKVSPGDEVSVQVSDGRINTKVISVSGKEDGNE